MKIKIAFMMVALAVAACGQTNQAVDNYFERGTRLSELKNKKLKEVSGIAASSQNPGLLWAHNDSGNDPEIYLINEDLEIVFTCSLGGIENRDWEDIAVGPGPEPGKNYIYLADIGDNKSVHPVKFVYRFQEPAYAPGKTDTVIASVDRIVFRLEDAVKDTESLMIDHKTRDLYVISKREDPVYVYRLGFPYNPGDTIIAKKVLSLPFHRIVAADYNQKNGDILVKNYDAVYYWKNSGQDLVELLKQKPIEVPYEKEPQGESITWSVGRPGFYTLSEKEKGEGSFLYFYKQKE